MSEASHVGVSSCVADGVKVLWWFLLCGVGSLEAGADFGSCHGLYVVMSFFSKVIIPSALKTRR